MQPRTTAAPPTEGEQHSLRRWVRLGAGVILLVNLGVGFFARQQQHAIIEYAMNVYDTAFISTNYIHLAQMAFQHYVDERLNAAPRAELQETLGNVLDNLDVAIERADSTHSRDMANAVRRAIAALGDGNLSAADLKPQLTDIQQQLEKLASHASAVGLQARDDIEGFSAKSDTLLLTSFVISITLVIAALILVERLLSQAEAARRTAAARKDAEMAATAARAAAEREKELAAKSKADRMSKALESFMRQMMEPTEKLHVAAQDLNSSAKSLRDMAQQASSQSLTVAAASEQATAMVQSAAHTSEEIAQTIADVRAHAVESTRLATGAVQEVLKTNATIDDLAAVAKEISEVTDLITRIAGQTNLLALNATIEAARAGDAGRGFAVVAQEVKTLASQTAKATDDIGRHVQAIQNATHRSVEAIQGVSQKMSDLQAFSTKIAAAVEQQAVATQEIAGNLTSAAGSVDDVNGAIGKVEVVGTRTAQAAELLSSASVSVNDQAKRIHEQVKAFTEEIQAIQIDAVAEDGLRKRISA